MKSPHNVNEILAQYTREDIAEAHHRLTLERFNFDRPALTSPRDTINFLVDFLSGRTQEVFVVLYLDTRHRVIEAVEEFRGSIDGAAIYPRVIAEHALQRGAAAVIVAHNHPSGNADPSLADQAITRRIKSALELLEIRLLDHFVIGGDHKEPVSFAARGML